MLVSRYTTKGKQYLPPQGVLLINVQQDQDRDS